MDLIERYFPYLTPIQKEQFGKLEKTYAFWNAQINVISRKDMEAFYERHVLHSLGIAKILSFQPGTKVLDIGTGGGFPGIPLAILFPETEFLLVDSIGKKIKVVKAVIEALNLENVQTAHIRAEEVEGQFDFIVSRAVTRMAEFIPLTKGKFLKEQKNELPNGILYLKGGDLTDELALVNKTLQVLHLNTYFTESFFETKKVVYVNCS
jgi:16S rRNA (guanine527-N7)-methyltransferase